MKNSKIEWTESTWNPITGCTKISPGCKNCYAERMAKRLQAMGQPNYKNGFEVTCHQHIFEAPLSWKKSRTVFVNSMSDLFHKSVPTNTIENIFKIMSSATQHNFQVLTKRAQRLSELSPKLKWTENIWMGVSVENEDFAWRIDKLRNTGAHIKFLSLEPLIGPISKLDLTEIDWVIVGGESGPRARPMDISWVTSIRDTCIEANVPFFFKQWGGVNKKKTGRILEGRTWDEMPSLSKAA